MPARNRRFAARLAARPGVAPLAVALVALVAAATPGAIAAATAPALVTPLDGEASFGEVVARAPAGARDAVVLVGGRWAGRTRVAGGQARFTVKGQVGPQAVTVRFVDGGRVVGAVTAKRVWLLPHSGLVARAAAVRDTALSDRLEELGRGFPGWTGLYVQDLATGRFGAWNSDAPFLGASTVKLGVLIEALRRFGPFPERSSAWPDIVAMITVSANDAANRLLARIGAGSDGAGSQAVDARFAAIGAVSTHFPGPYRLEQARGAARGSGLDAPSPPPFLPWRRTTAHDLGRIMRAIHAAALGNSDALRRTGLTLHEARLALALLLAARADGGALAGAVRPDLAVAQKTGYRDDVRNAAAIVYTPDGPKIVVVVSYGRPRIDAGAVGRLARGVAAAAGVAP